MQSLEGFLIQEGVATPLTVLKASNVQRELSLPIGQIALAEQMLTIPQIADILEHQAKRNMKFGEWAVELGYLTQDQVTRLLEIQVEARPSIAKLLVEMGAVSQTAMDALLVRYQRL